MFGTWECRRRPRRCQRGPGLQRLQVVQNIDRLSRQADEFRVGVFAGPLATVHVSSDGGDRRNLAKRIDDLGPPDVACMNDVVDAGQASFRLGPQQTMRIRNDSDPEHHYPALSPTIVKRRSRSSTCPDSNFVRANSTSNHSARSTSGKYCRRPLRGGHSISKVLLASAVGSKRPSPANVMTRFPPRCRTSPSSCSRPIEALGPSSSANSRRAPCSGSSKASISPFGMDQAPSSLLRQNGPPGCTSSTSSPCAPLR